MQLSQPIALIGPPGSGKGTQGRILSQTLKVPHLDFGNTLRTLQADTSIPLAVKKIVEPPFPRGSRFDVGFQKELFWVILETNKVSPKEPLIIDGCARDTVSAQILDETIGDFTAINLVVSKALSRERTAQRADREADGNDIVIERRLNFYAQHTLAVIERLRTQGKVIFIHPAPHHTIEQVHAKCIERLKEAGVLN